jgi:hypothetical protein
MTTDRRPLAKIEPPRTPESREPISIRLKPSELDKLKDLALTMGLGHTTFARECLLTGLRMAYVERLMKEDTRVTA